MTRIAKEAEREEERQRIIAEEKRMLMVGMEMRTTKEAILKLPDSEVLTKASKNPSLKIKPQRVIHDISSVKGPFLLIASLMLACMMLTTLTQSRLIGCITLPSSALIGMILYWWDWNRKVKCECKKGILYRIQFRDTEIAYKYLGSDILDYSRSYEPYKSKPRTSYPIWCGECGEKHVVQH